MDFGISEKMGARAPLARADILKKIEQLKQVIWQRRPILGEIMKQHGDDTLFDYAQDFMDVNPSPVLDNRKHELINIVEGITSERLGTKIGQEVAAQLQSLPLVSTADHHAPIQHPFWVNANIISAVPYFGFQNSLVKNLIVFSFASVSTNNASGYPRGILLHGSDKGFNTLIRLPLLPDKFKMSTVYGTRSFTEDEVSRALKMLGSYVDSGEVASDVGYKVCEIIKNFYASAGVLSAKDLCSQITKLNFDVWPYLFRSDEYTQGFYNQDQAPSHGPGLIYIEIETIVKELLIRFHLQGDTLLSKLIFDSKCQRLLGTLFNNIPGAFSNEKHWGTHLFWALDAKGHRVQLTLENNKLVSVNKDIVIDLTPQSITEALEKRLIFPGMMLCYTVVSLYYGMKCLGGFSQVNDLTMMKRAWQEWLHVLNETEEANALQAVQTKELGGDGMVLAYISDAFDNMVPATGIDLILDAHKPSWAEYIHLSKRVTLNEMMESMLPEIYTVLYASTERDASLLEVTAEAISQATQLKHKLKTEKTVYETNQMKLHFAV